jgi:hypothetical protein
MAFAFWKEEPLCLIVEVLWGMSEPHLHLFDKLTIFLKVAFMNSLLHWMKEVKFGWPNLDFVVDGQNSPIQFCDDFSCSHTGLQLCILNKRRTSCIFCYTLTCLMHQWSVIPFFHNFDQNDPIHVPEDFLIMFHAMGAVLELLLWHCAIQVHEMLFHFWLKAVNSYPPSQFMKGSHHPHLYRIKSASQQHCYSLQLLF